jgi:hypothetical protein
MGSAVASDASLWGSEFVRFGVPSRGRYRITLPSMTKFGDVPPIEVEVADDDIERVIELTPL